MQHHRPAGMGYIARGITLLIEVICTDERISVQDLVNLENLSTSRDSLPPQIGACDWMRIEGHVNQLADALEPVALESSYPEVLLTFTEQD